MTQLWVDARYRGSHGIGRYASEVTSRLEVPWLKLPAAGKPASVTDLLSPLSGVTKNDVVYSPGYAAFPTRARQVLTIHDLIHLSTPWPGRAKYAAYYEGLVRRAVQRSGVVFTVSNTSAHALRAWLGRDDISIVNTGNACSETFVPTGPVAAADNPYILYVGNLRKHKNVDVVFRVLRQLKDISLRMLVPQSEVVSAISLADHYGVGAQTTVMSGLSDEVLAGEYRGATATILPSQLEGFGLPALESVCCGTPVVYWAGCAAIAEASLGRGHAVHNLTDTAEWVQKIELIGRSGDFAAPAVHPTWDSVAHIVQAKLSAVIENS